jgi:hypothetical protein
MIVEKQLECRLAGDTEVLGENLPQRHICPSQNPTWPDPCLNSGRRGGKPATNRLSYGAAKDFRYVCTIEQYAFGFYLFITNALSLSLSPVFLVAPTWRIGHPWNSFVSLQFLNIKTADMASWTGDLSFTRPLPTQDNTNRINAHRHPCLEWNSNPRPQRSSDRRQFMP